MENGSNAFLCDTYTFCGDAGATRMYNLLRLLCHDVPADLGGMRVLFLRDHARGTELDLTALRTRPFPCEHSAAVELTLTDGTILLYPADGSPVLKADFTAHGASPKEADTRLERMRSAMQTWFRQRT